MLWVVARDFHYFHYLARCTRNTYTHTHTHPATQRAQTVRFSLIERHFDEILVERTHLRHVQLNAKQKAKRNHLKHLIGLCAIDSCKLKMLSIERYTQFILLSRSN